MRKRRFGRFTLTPKRFKRCLAALGVLTLWLAALSVLVLPSSHASAERTFDVQIGLHPSIHVTKGGGTAYRDTIAEEIARKSGLDITKEIRELCPSWLLNCEVNPEPRVEKFDLHGSGISFSTGTSHRDIGGSSQQRVAGDFATDNPSGGASFAGAFGGFGLSSSAFGYGASSPAGNVDPVQDGTEALTGIKNSGSNDPMRANPTIDESANDAKDPANNIFPNIGGDIDPSKTDNGKRLPTGDVPVGGAPSTPLSIPEPFTLSLFATGLIASVAARTGGSFLRTRQQSRHRCSTKSGRQLNRSRARSRSVQVASAPGFPCYGLKDTLFVLQKFPVIGLAQMAPKFKQRLIFARFPGRSRRPFPRFLRFFPVFRPECAGNWFGRACLHHQDQFVAGRVCSE